MAARAGGQDAVEHVDPARHRLDQVDRLADPHQIARPLGGQQSRGVVEYLAHRLMALADRQAADGVAVEPGLHQPLGGFPAKRLDGRPLLDAEQGLALTLSERRLAARAPPGGQPQGLGGPLGLGRLGDALVQLHDDVRAQQVGLDLDRALRRQDMPRAVDVALEGTASSRTVLILPSDMT